MNMKIQNLKYFEKQYKSNKIEIYLRLYNIFLLLKIYKKLNSFTINFKTLKNHLHSIYHIDKLNVKRLISISANCLLNIYKKIFIIFNYKLKNI